MRVRRRTKRTSETPDVSPEIRPTPAPSKSKGKRQVHPPHMKSEETKRREAETTRNAGAMKLRGLTYAQIAEQLGVEERTARKYVDVALSQYGGEITEIANELVRDALGRYDSFMRTHWIRVFGGYETDEHGNRKRVEPDPEFGRLFLRAQRDLLTVVAKLAPPNQRLEITGAAGSPIVTANIDASEMARLMRGEFVQAAHQVEAIEVPALPSEPPEAYEEAADVPPIADAAR